MNNPLFFISRYSTLKETIIKEYRSASTTNFMVFGYIFALFSSFYGIGEMMQFLPKNIPDLPNFLIALVMLIGIFIGICTVLYYFIHGIIINPYSRYLDKIISAIKTTHILIESGIHDQQTITEILDKLQQILDLSQRVVRLDKKIHKSQKLTKDYGSLVSESIEWIVTILSKLRSDLTLRVTEQQEILESAKSEVEKNIQGTTELEQVSELQKTRLDRQIEQFEELQRVLVKV